MRDQTRKTTKCTVAFAGLGNIRPSDKKISIKGSRREFHQKRNTITSRYATLDTVIHSLTTAISLTGNLDFLPHQNPESKY